VSRTDPNCYQTGPTGKGLELKKWERVKDWFEGVGSYLVQAGEGLIRNIDP